MAKYPEKSSQYLIGKRIRSRYRSAGLIENKPKDPSQTSYTAGKGQIVALCLRKPNGFVDMDLIRFVDLHEMAHIGTRAYGHPEEFWNNFKFLLAEAKEAGFYTPVDYSQKGVMYCGLKVDYNPLYDANLGGQPTEK